MTLACPRTVVETVCMRLGSRVHVRQVRALAVINPGNPTGQVLPPDNIAAVLAWCEKEDIAVLVRHRGRKSLMTKALNQSQLRSVLPCFSRLSRKRGAVTG